MKYALYVPFTMRLACSEVQSLNHFILYFFFNPSVLDPDGFDLQMRTLKKMILGLIPFQGCISKLTNSRNRYLSGNSAIILQKICFYLKF